MAEEIKRAQSASSEKRGGGSCGSGERCGAGAFAGGVKHGTVETPASNGRQGSGMPVNPRHGGGSSVGGR